MKKVHLLLLALLLSGSMAFAQQGKAERPVKGTYQIEVSNTRHKPLIPNNLEELVRANRKANEISYVRIGENVRLIILPESTIAKPNFVPFEREVIHVFN